MISRAMDESHNNGAGGSGQGGQQQHLEYLADLLGELQQMAEREGYRKLSRMLAISHAEAQRETHRRGT